MAFERELKNLVNVNINRDKISIQGVSIPIMFNVESFAYVSEAYGKPYGVFEKDLKNMLGDKGKVSLGPNETKIMHALIYATVKSGGTNCTIEEIQGSVRIEDLKNIFQKVLDIFQQQDFQKSDLEKLKTSTKKK